MRIRRKPGSVAVLGVAVLLSTVGCSSQSDEGTPAENDGPPPTVAMAEDKPAGWTVDCSADAGDVVFTIEQAQLDFPTLTDEVFSGAAP